MTTKPTAQHTPETMKKEIQGWEETARLYAQNAEYWRAQHREACDVLRALLKRIDDMTSAEFACGEERLEREAARALLAKIEGGK
jgi:hypothetical protein